MVCQAWGRGRESGLGQQGGGDVAGVRGSP